MGVEAEGGTYCERMLDGDGGRAVVPREGADGTANADNHNPSPFEMEFSLLGEALTLLVSKLRKDDSKPELVDELNDSGGPPSHNYFTDPWSERVWGPQLVYEGVIPIPGAIRSQFSRIECMSFMGILPEIGHAWLSVDNRLFLWDYERGGEGEFQQYTGFAQLIVSVALVPPKPGLFKDVVKYLLVVSTPVEISLLACTYEDKDGERRMKLRPTAFSARSDGISMLKSAGHPNGRVFCAGQDGCLYELSYDVDPGFLYTYLGIGGRSEREEGSSRKRRKCEKIDLTSALGASLVPAFIKGVIQGGRRISLVDVVVDPFRGFVATLDNVGNMDLYDLGPHSKACHHVGCKYDVWNAAKEMCARASRWGNRAHDLPEARTFTTGHGMSLVSLHVVDVSTSSRCHLVAVSDTGFRFYMTTSRGVGGGWNATASSKRQVPSFLSILHIRAPPSPELRSFLDSEGGSVDGGKNSNDSAAVSTTNSTSLGASARSRPGTQHKEDIGGGRSQQPNEGFVPSYSSSRGGGVRGGGGRGKVHTALFSGGVTIYTESRGEDNDLVLTMGPDTTSRRAPNADGTTEELPSLRESVSIVGKSRFQGKVWAMAEVPTFLRPGLGALGGVGSEIEDHRGLSATHLAALLATSRTPSDSEIALRVAQGQSRRKEAEQALQRIKEGAMGGKENKKSFGMSTQRPPLPSASSMTRAWHESWDESPRPLPPPPPTYLPPAGGGWRAGLLPHHLHSGAVLPLMESSTQCGGVLPPRRFLCLTHTGLHMLRRRRPIDGLMELFQGERYDQVSHFFSSYGREEACAMSFAVACQCVSPDNPPGAGSAADLRQSAISAALQHGGPPKVSPSTFSHGDNSAGGGVGGMQVVAPPSGSNAFSSSSPSNSRAVFMEEFSYSFYHDGLALFLSRLLRPALFHPVVVSDSSMGGGGTKSASSSADASSATTKLSPLLDRGELCMLHAPLHRLLGVMREVFPQAVENKQRGGITVNQHWGSGAEAARRHEDRSLNRLYKLIHRTLQAISLLNLLIDVSERQPHVKIDWDLFRGMQFWELITSAESHACVGRLLSVLLQPLSSGIEPVLADQYADELARSCFLYFSQGDRLTYEGFKSLSPGKGEQHGGGTGNGYYSTTTPSTSAVNRGIDLLSRAATFWSSPSDLAPGGRLEMACRELTRLGREDGVVDVCLSCAGNFTGGTHPPLNGILSKTSNTLDDLAASEMEKNLHHGDVVRGDTERKAARDYCYELIFQALGGLVSAPFPDARGGEDVTESAGTPQHLSSSGGENGYAMNTTTTDKADGVLSRVLRSNDSDFHTALYNFLRTRDAARLVRIRSPLIEDYLREKDIYLLYQHFSVHGLHRRALELMADVARSGKPIPLDERIVLLTRAINSGKRAAEKLDSEASGSYSLAQLEDELEVAQLQQRVLRTLEETSPSISSSSTTVSSTALSSRTEVDGGHFESGSLSALRTNLLTVSDLYNNYAQARGLWELCLSIIHCCNRDVPELVRDMWKSIIYRMVPSQTRDVDVGQWLVRQRLGVLQDPPGFAIPPGSCVAAQLFLEDVAWISPLAAKVESLARELYAEGTPDFTFPLNLIVDELEGISCHHSKRGRGGRSEAHWVVNCLHKAGIPWPKLLLAYNACVRACERRDAVDQVIKCVLFVLYGVHATAVYGIIFSPSHIDISLQLNNSCMCSESCVGCLRRGFKKSNRETGT